MSTLIKLDKTSSIASASEPSEEFPYGWVDTTNNEIGFFHRTIESALTAANSNYLGFGGSLGSRNVILIKAVGWANKA